MFLFLFLLLVFWCGVGTISQINFVVVVVVLSFSPLLRLLFFVCSFFDLVGSQSRVGDRLLRIGVVSRQNGTAVCLESVHLCLFLCETVKRSFVLLVVVVVVVVLLIATPPCKFNSCNTFGSTSSPHCTSAQTQSDPDPYIQPRAGAGSGVIDLLTPLGK